MKNFYKNNNKLQKVSFEKNKKQSYIPKPNLEDRKPKFFPGDVVGCKTFYNNQEGVILHYRTDKFGAIEYVVKLTEGFSIGNTQVCKRYELYLKPLTRKVLIEKIFSFKTYDRNRFNFIVISGGTCVWE